MRFLGSILIIVAFLPLISLSRIAAAQGGGNPSSTFDPKLKEILSKRFGLSIDSPVMVKFFDALQNPKKYEKTPRAVDDIPVIKHIRGQEGIAFPTKDSIAAYERERARENAETVEKLFGEQQFQDQYSKIIEGILEQRDVRAPELESCAKDETEVVAIDENDRSTSYKGEEILGDLLVTKGPVPLDTDLAFGRRTRVIQYTTQKNDYLSLGIASQQPGCLPYRVRFTAKHYIYDYGLNALKNYDENPKGVLYEGINARLREYK